MPKLRYTKRSASNLLDIVDFLISAGADEAVAQSAAEELRAKCRALAGLPGTLGRPRPGIAPGLRSFPFRGYVIFFRYRDDLFEVVSILDGRRDIEAQFEGGPAEA